MKKILFIIILLILLVGCTAQKRGQERVGKEGVVISFFENTPPAQVFDFDLLVIGINVFNKGFSDAKVDLYITGLDTGTFVITKNHEVVSLEGKKTADMRGGLAVVEFEYEITKLKEKGGLDSFKTNFIVTACYDYKTFFSSELCINPNPYNRRFVPCQLTIKEFSAGQGAPVAVTGLETVALKGKTLLKIYVENVGDGTIFSNAYSCSPFVSVDQKDLDWVKVEKVMVRNADITGSCKPLSDGRIKLYNKKGFVICEFSEEESARPYLTEFSLVLSYSYGNSIMRNLEVLATP